MRNGMLITIPNKLSHGLSIKQGHGRFLNVVSTISLLDLIINQPTIVKT